MSAGEHQATEPQIRQAAERLQAGGLVAFPTETVYGLGADAENPEAIARIYAAKGRPSSHPLIVHVAPGADISYWAASVPPEAQALMQAFWPGPLTLILPRAPHIPDAVAGGQDTIGLRCPAHPVAQALLQAFARLRPNGQAGVAGPSANKFGQVSPTRADHVRSEFPELDDTRLLVLEGGASQVGIESTIVDVSRIDLGVGPVLLRPGHITAEQIRQVLGVSPAAPDQAAPRVSGSLKAHYAPRTPLVLVPAGQWDQALANADSARTAAITFAAQPPLPQAAVWECWPSDPVRVASRLYEGLRRLDQQGYTCIFVEQPPQGPDWQAVNDRLGRAAAAFV